MRRIEKTAQRLHRYAFYPINMTIKTYDSQSEIALRMLAVEELGMRLQRPLDTAYWDAAVMDIKQSHL